MSLHCVRNFPPAHEIRARVLRAILAQLLPHYHRVDGIATGDGAFLFHFACVVTIYAESARAISSMHLPFGLARIDKKYFALQEEGEQRNDDDVYLEDLATI